MHNKITNQQEIYHKIYKWVIHYKVLKKVSLKFSILILPLDYNKMVFYFYLEN